MPLRPPPRAAGSLSRLPAHRLGGGALLRVWRYVLPDGGRRESPWWFASLPDDPDRGGRYDLPPPLGTCYAATSIAGALLEALQMHLTNLPAPELEVRRLARLKAPADAPPAVRLTARRLAGDLGLTAELWGGRNHRASQQWAAALRRDGWWALYGGIRHDPSGQLRGYALFDHEGAHPPTHGAAWQVRVDSLHDDADVAAELGRYGVHVREPGTLPIVRPADVDPDAP